MAVDRTKRHELDPDTGRPMPRDNFTVNSKAGQMEAFLDKLGELSDDLMKHQPVQPK
jgi:hypothetical protein